MGICDLSQEQIDLIETKKIKILARILTAERSNDICPMCKEKISEYEPGCYNCGYDFRPEREVQK